MTQSLRLLYKGTFFVLQASHFLKSSRYVFTKKELVEKLEGLDKEILEISMNKENIDEKEAYEKLIK